MKTLGRVWEITAASYGVLLVALYVAAVIVGFVWAGWLGFVLLIPVIPAFLIWRDA